MARDDRAEINSLFCQPPRREETMRCPPLLAAGTQILSLRPFCSGASWHFASTTGKKQRRREEYDDPAPHDHYGGLEQSRLPPPPLNGRCSCVCRGEQHLRQDLVRLPCRCGRQQQMNAAAAPPQAVATAVLAVAAVVRAPDQSPPPSPGLPPTNPYASCRQPASRARRKERVDDVHAQLQVRHNHRFRDVRQRLQLAVQLLRSAGEEGER